MPSEAIVAALKETAQKHCETCRHHCHSFEAFRLKKGRGYVVRYEKIKLLGNTMPCDVSFFFANAQGEFVEDIKDDTDIPDYDEEKPIKLGNCKNNWKQ